MPPAAIAAASPAARVPYLAKPQVRRAAAVLLAAYGAAHGPVLAPPVPVDDVLELHLGLALEIADLRARFGVGDVLGAIWFADRTVRVDAGLDPSADRRRLGRYRFTLAHEAGHWVLHRRHFLAGPAGYGADGEDGPAHVCRSSGSKEPVEWQADYFAGHLLMPSDLVRAAWESWRGSLCPAGPTEVGSADGDDPASAARRFVRPLADRFEASADAMRIRLGELGLLSQQPNQSF